MTRHVYGKAHLQARHCRRRRGGSRWKRCRKCREMGTNLRIPLTICRLSRDRNNGAYQHINIATERYIGSKWKGSNWLLHDKFGLLSFSTWSFRVVERIGQWIPRYAAPWLDLIVTACQAHHYAPLSQGSRGSVMWNCCFTVSYNFSYGLIYGIIVRMPENQLLCQTAAIF